LDASELDYHLPEGLIAQAPLPERDAARLLCLDREHGSLEHRCVRDLPELLPPALIVLNDTRVIPARLFAEKTSGGRVEFLLIERLSAGPAQGVVPADPASPAGQATMAGAGMQRWSALGQTSRGVRAGMTLRVADGFSIEIESLAGGGELVLRLNAHDGVDAALERHGHVPLPPYIRRTADSSDRARYQTVFATQPGAVAAPTAGLHLSEPLLAALTARGHELAYVTLHVGPGTFAPLRSERLSEHRMHAERYGVPEATALAVARAQREGRPVLAIGTTVVRALESAAGEGGTLAPGFGSTSIFIYPPYRFRVVSALLTNFHLPRSTLLALVMAFAGTDAVRLAYAAAVAERYRFFSYGDAMLIRTGT
jgi:S-adenosylmethionine:tRNA ribosyltransferase-isomerase